MARPVNNLRPVVFLMGPTASGKTGLAVELVKRLPLEIVSVDSAMVYRGLNIGTAKPSAGILKIAPHRLIDICEPTETYSAGSFCRDARIAIAEIHAADRVPLLVGGTGLYFRSLEQGFSSLPAADPVIRIKLDTEAKALGWDRMHDRLARVDPAAAAKIHRHDPQRIQRALEIYEITGRPLSEFHSDGRSEPLLHPLIKLIIAPGEGTRAKQREIISDRFMRMLDAGLVDEVRGLYERGDLTGVLASMRLVGYRQVWQYLEGKVNYNDMINKAITATRQLAKRQMTWLRSEQNANWFDSGQPKLSHSLLNFLADYPIILS